MKASFAPAILAAAACALCLSRGSAAGNDSARTPARSGNLGPWAHERFVAWEVAPFDTHLTPEGRAQLLEKLGFRHFAYDWHAQDIPVFDAQIAALERHRIDTLAWWFPFDGDDPVARAALEAIERHRLRPQLWVPHAAFYAGNTPQGLENVHLPQTPALRRERVEREAQRIERLVKLTEPYGCLIELYTHGGWFGILENELAILRWLEQRGIADVGIVYNFSHSRDTFHDDTRDFPALWKKIQAHVVAVNIGGVHGEGQLLYPSQGDSELKMMRTIQQSGWRGPIVVSGDQRNDAQTALENYILGIDWLAAELDRRGSAGPRPFPRADGRALSQDGGKPQ